MRVSQLVCLRPMLSRNRAMFFRTGTLTLAVICLLFLLFLVWSSRRALANITPLVKLLKLMKHKDF